VPSEDILCVLGALTPTGSTARGLPAHSSSRCSRSRPVGGPDYVRASNGPMGGVPSGFSGVPIDDIGES